MSVEPSVRDELAALRLPRQPRPPGLRPRAGLGVGRVVGLAVGLIAGALARGAWTETPMVQVEYTSRALGPGSGQAPAPALSASGYVVTAGRYLSLGVRVPGRIEALLAGEGDRVEAGQPLVRLDSRRYVASVRRAQADLDQARATLELRVRELERARELWGSDVASQAAFDAKWYELRAAEAAVARFEALVAQLQLDLDDTILRAPVAGAVLEKLKEVGEIATPGGFTGSGDLIRLANLEELRARVDVAETELSRLRLGQRAEVAPDAFPERRYAARVVALAPFVDRRKGTLEVEVKISEPDSLLKPDMSARVSFFEGAPADGPPANGSRVIAPASALRFDAEGAYVWVVSRGTLRRQPVRTRRLSTGEVLVTEGLVGGEAVAVGRLPELRAGMSVEASDD